MARRALVSLVVLATVLLPGTPAAAGTVWEYPEFPYQPTTYAEPFRGQFHFSSQGGWMNDPNGLVHANGLYHLFYQHNPHGLEWDTMHWGHATSPDLVRWTQKPVALEPGVHPGTLFSGGGVVDTDNTSGLRTGSLDPIVVFSNTNGVSIFYSNDNGRTFQAYDKGRKQLEIPAESRDPNVVWDAARQRWVMVIWSDEGGNGVTFHTSPDLLRWTPASRYAAPWLFECPDLYPLSLDGVQRWVLTFYLGASTAGDAVYQGDIRLDTARAGGLTFRANAEGVGYTANVDTSGVVKLWRPGRDIATHATPVVEGRTYHLTVRTDGPRIRVWLDNGTDPVIDATDTTHPTGRFGVNAYAGNTTAQNLTLG